MHIYRYTGNMTVMLENGGNFENGMPILSYQIYLYLIKFHTINEKYSTMIN